MATSSILASIVVAVLAAPAAATVHVITFSGTVSVGLDLAGAFGTPIASLTGRPYTASYAYDLSLGTRTTSTGIADAVTGGDLLGTVSPIIDASLTINGITHHFGSQDGMGTAKYLQLGLGSLGVYGVAARSGSPYLATVAVIPGFTPSLDNDLALRSDVTWKSEFLIGSANPLQFAFGILGPGPNSEFSIQTLVPEPASWTMMIAGFGLVGVAARRNSRSLASATPRQPWRPARLARAGGRPH